MPIRFSTAVCAVLLTLPLGRALADVAPDHAEKMARGLKLFKNGVGQMLKQHCVKCHGGEKTRGDFDITTREALLKGGSEGAARLPIGGGVMWWVWCGGWQWRRRRWW